MSTPPAVAFSQKLSVGLAVLLIVTYGLSMLFSLKTHRESFGSVHMPRSAKRRGRWAWPWPRSAGVTVLVALVSEIFVESVQKAAEAFGMTPAFVGFIILSLVGGASAMPTAFSGARKNRLDLSVGIALGSASQIALFVAPVLVLVSYVIGPTPMDLQFWPGAVVMMLIAAMTASMVTNSGRSAWFVGCLMLMVYAIFAMTLYLLPPRVHESDAWPDDPIKSKRVLEPSDRIAEVLFGLIMVLTFTGSISVAHADRDEVRTMLIGALGCNLAWGIIDAMLYLMGNLSEKGQDS